VKQLRSRKGRLESPCYQQQEQQQPQQTYLTNLAKDKSQRRTQQTTQLSSKAKRAYVPKPRSGPWALLLALHQARKFSQHNDGSLSKTELIRLAQPLCDSSFFKVGIFAPFLAFHSRTHTQMGSLTSQSLRRV
jgi:hypothetical protein